MRAAFTTRKRGKATLAAPNVVDSACDDIQRWAHPPLFPLPLSLSLPLFCMRCFFVPSVHLSLATAPPAIEMPVSFPPFSFPFFSLFSVVSLLRVFCRRSCLVAFPSFPRLRMQSCRGAGAAGERGEAKKRGKRKKSHGTKGLAPCSAFFFYFIFFVFYTFSPFFFKRFSAVAQKRARVLDGAQRGHRCPNPRRGLAEPGL